MAAKTFMILMWSIVLAFCSDNVARAQGIEPIIPGFAVSGGHPLPTSPQDASVSASAPADIGQPGLSYRYVQTYGETRTAYFEDSSHLNHPIGLTVNGANLWVGELHGRRAMNYTTNGQFVSQIGRAGISDIQGTNLSSISDLAIDGGGNVWIADEATSQVIKFDASGNYLSEIGTRWNCGAGNHQFCYPISVAFDAAGRYYVSDGAPVWNLGVGNHRIQVFNANGTYLTTIGSTRIPGQGNLQLSGPRRVSIFDNLLYVADAGNHRVQILNITNPLAPVYIATLGVSGVAGNDNGHLAAPSGVAVDANFIYVADTWNNRVQIFNRSTRAYVTTIGGDWGSGSEQLKNPMDVAVDNVGNLFVADIYNMRVQVFNSAYQHTNTLGVTGVPYQTDNSHFYQPRGVAVAGDGALYITEESGNRLVKLNAVGQPLWSVGQGGIDGGWRGENDLLNAPDGIAIAPNGHVFVADRYNSRVQVFDDKGNYVRTLGEPGISGTDNTHFNYPRGVAFGPNGFLYVADSDNHRIQIFDTSFNYVATLGVTAQVGADNNHFNTPFDVVVDSGGLIYVADTLNHRVQVFDANRTYLRTLGITGEAGNDFGHFREPGRLAVDAMRRLFVADGWNGRIQVFDAGGAYLTTIGGGTSSRSGDLKSAFGVAIDGQGNVYATDYWDNHRVQRYAPGVPNWLQRNVNGFGDRNRYVNSLAPFGDHLYAGTAKSAAFGAQIWRMDGAGNWSSVTAEGFGVQHNTGVDHLTEFKGRLYAGVRNSTSDAPYTDGGEIWRSINGSDWEQVASGGFDNLYNGGIFHMAVYGDHLYAGTWSYTSTLGAEIWRSSTGNAGDWTQVAANGFGNSDNLAVLTMQEFDGHLYVGTRSRTNSGADIWRYNGAIWTPVITDGFGYTNTYDISALAVLGDYLYAGTGRYATTTQGTSGGQIWRCARSSGCDNSDDWGVVIADGFGKASNVNITALQTFDHSLYAVTYNELSGMEVWRTLDGASWDQVGYAGLGDSNNSGPYWSNVIEPFNGSLYLGAYNGASAGKVWQYLRERTSVNITDPALAYTLVFTPTSGGRTTIAIPANAVDQTTELIYQPVTPTSRPPSSAFAGRAFDLGAYRGGVLVENLQFQQPVIVTIEYSNADVASFDEETLLLYHWDPARAIWEDSACGAYVRNPAQNRVSVPICHLSRFGLFGTMEYLYLPALKR